GFLLDKRGGALAEVIVDLGESFQGGLVHLALHFTHGRDLAYSAVLPWAETAAPSPDRSAVIATPLPAGGWMMLSALALALGLRPRRRAG
ncbi:MAG: hypothetical protein AAF676_08975, partial [Pseudomonadota bacterium]